MTYQNNDILRGFLKRGAAEAHQIYIDVREFLFDTAAFEKTRAEVQFQHPQLSPEESAARAAFRLLTSASARTDTPKQPSPEPSGAPPEAAPATPTREERLFAAVKRLSVRYWPWVKIAWAAVLLILVLVLVARAEPDPPKASVNAVRAAFRGATNPFGLPQVGGGGNAGGGTVQARLWIYNGSSWVPATSGNPVQVTCVSGCSAGGAFTDNSAFTVGTTSVSPIGAYYTSGADPTLSSGNAARVRMDSHSYLFVDCVVGFAGGSTTPADAFANPSTAGLQFDLLAGYNGSAWDRLRVDGGKNLLVSVNAALPAGTNVIGHVVTDSGSVSSVTFASPQGVTQSGNWSARTQDGSGTAITSNSTTTTSTQGLDINIRSILNTAPTTAGKLDVKGADGDVFVRQSTAANLKATAVLNDGSGNAITSTSSALDVNLKSGAIPTGSNTIGSVKLTDGTNTAIVDPCVGQTKSYVNISLTANTKLITGTSAKKIYICQINLVVASATNVALVEGTGTACGTSTAGVMGGSTAATGWNLAANGGLVVGNGASAVAAEATNADDLCLFVSAANQTSGNIAYVVQ
jgi:hypothetical protein